MAGYSKEFLIDAFIDRYAEILMKDTKEECEKYIQMVTDFFDKVGRDKFRVWCSLDADRIKAFKLKTGRKG